MKKKLYYFCSLVLLFCSNVLLLMSCDLFSPSKKVSNVDENERIRREKREAREKKYKNLTNVVWELESLGNEDFPHRDKDGGKGHYYFYFDRDSGKIVPLTRYLGKGETEYDYYVDNKGSFEVDDVRKNFGICMLATDRGSGR